MKTTKACGLRRRLTRLALLVLFATQAVAVGAAPSQKKNVILLVLDTLQADHLHCYGNPRPTSPNIDRLAERGTRFSHFFTVASWTSPSFGSLHTSLYPSRHGVTLLWRPGMPLIDKDTPTFVEALRDHGYYTAAFVENSLAGRDLTGRGFDEYHANYASAVNITERRATTVCDTAPCTTHQVLCWLDRRRSQPFFLYVHFLEPHSPYNPPPEDDLFKSAAYPYMSFTGYDIAHGALLRLATLGDQRAIERLDQLYDGNIHFVDGYVGLLLDRVRSLGLEGKTVIALTSDHGELLFTHPRDFLTFGHRSLYDADLHIPLIVAGPGIPEGRVVDALGSNIDTAPALLDLAGAPPLSGAEGRSLVPLIEGKTSSVNQYVFAEEDAYIPERSVRSMRYKLIRNLWTGKEQLFDLESDPSELVDVAKENPEVVRDLSARLSEWMRQNQPSREIQLRRWRIYTQPEKIVIVDDQTTARFLLTGREWHSDVALESGNYGGGCFWTPGGGGSRVAIWGPDNPLVGAYRISVYFGHPSVGQLASDAPFTVVTESSSKTVRINFNQKPGEWHLLGVFENPRSVRLTNGANGIVIADAVRFERLD